MSLRSIKIWCHRTGRRKQDAPLFIKRVAIPRTTCANRIPPARYPSFTARFTDLRNNIKTPNSLTALDRERHNRPRRRTLTLSGSESNKNEISINGRCSRNANVSGRNQLLSQINRAELRSKLTLLGID